MGIYKVQSNGFAPPGLQVGDQVVTGGGTYVITVVKADGSYQSRLVNSGQTTGTYSGAYDTPGTVKTNPLITNPGTVNPGSGGDLNSILGNIVSREKKSKIQELVDEAGSSGYQPVVEADDRALSAMSFEEALALAEQVMEPQYTGRYQQAAANAAQRLEQAGLYDTLYGQALAAEAEQDISRDLNAAIYALALQLASASQEDAFNLLKLAVDERQFGADYDAQQRETALSYLLKLLQLESAS